MAVLGLRFCARVLCTCGKRGPLFIAVRGPLTIVASLVAEHRVQTHRLSNCGSRAQLLHGMWDLPRPGPEPVSPALAGRLSTTAPPGKPHFLVFLTPLFNLCCGRLVPIYVPDCCVTWCLVSISQSNIHILGQFKRLLQTIIILISISMVIISSWLSPFCWFLVRLLN